MSSDRPSQTRNEGPADAERSAAPGDAAPGHVSASQRVARVVEAVNADLRERVDDLEALLEVARVGIAFADSPDCAEIRLNRYGARMMGLPKLIPPAGGAAPYRILMHGREVPPEELPLQTAWRTGKPVGDFRATFEHKDGTTFEFLMSATPVFDQDGKLRRVIGIYDDITSMSRAQADAERRAIQQNYVAALGTRSLRGQSVEELFDSVAHEVAEVLSADFVKVLQYRSSSNDFHLRASYGFYVPSGAPVVVPGGNRSQAGYALKTGEPIFVEDLRTDLRFNGPELLVSHGVRSGLSVAIGDFDKPWGVLGVHSRERRSFDEHDVQFLQAVANVIAATIQRDETERHQRVLLAELQHRVKNSLATVQAIASLSFRHAVGVETELEVFRNRIRALSSAHDLLFQRKWKSVELADIVRAQLAPFEDKAKHIAVEGPADVVMSSNAAMEMGMVLHELATNAVKYGALSVDRGRLHIGWRVSGSKDGEWLAFEWRERGGPAVEMPKVRGVGTTLIGAAFHGFPGAKVEVDFRPEGLICRMRVPLDTQTA